MGGVMFSTYGGTDGILLCEIWDGLPAYDFVEVRTARGPALRVNKPGQYVWVPPSVVASLRQSPDQLLFALGTRCGEEKMNIFWVALAENFTSAIQQAEQFNRRSILQAELRSLTK